MAAIERLEMPTNVPVTGTVVYDCKPDDPGKEFPSSRPGGGTFKAWGVVIDVHEHPDVPPGTRGRISCYEDDWMTVLQAGLRKGQKATFLFKEKTNPETHKKYRVLVITKDGAAPTESAAPARSRPAGGAPVPAGHARLTMAQATAEMARVYLALTAAGVSETAAGPMVSTMVIAAGRGELEWGGWVDVGRDSDEPDF